MQRKYSLSTGEAIAIVLLKLYGLTRCILGKNYSRRHYEMLLLFFFFVVVVFFFFFFFFLESRI